MNFNRENMPALFVHRPRRRDRIIPRNEQTRFQPLLPTLHATRHNARLWLEVGLLLLSSFLYPTPGQLRFVSFASSVLRIAPTNRTLDVHTNVPRRTVSYNNRRFRGENNSSGETATSNAKSMTVRGIGELYIRREEHGRPWIRQIRARIVV